VSSSYSVYLYIYIDRLLRYNIPCVWRFYFPSSNIDAMPRNHARKQESAENANATETDVADIVGSQFNETFDHC
jgi:hypothetical protein